VAELLDGGLDLGGLAGCYVLIAILVIVAWTFGKLADAIDFSISIPYVFGTKTIHPLGGVAQAIENSVVAGCNDGIKALEGAAADFENGLLQSLELIVGLTLLLGVGVKDALVKLWGVALDSRIHAIVDATSSVASKASSDVSSLAKTVADDVTKAESYAAGKATAALTDAKSYTEMQVAGLATKLAGDLATLTDSTIPHLIGKDLAKGGAIAESIAKAVEGAGFETAADVGSLIANDLRAGGSIATAIANAVAAAGAITAGGVESVITNDLRAGGSIASAIANAIPGAAGIGNDVINSIHDTVAGLISDGLAAGGDIADAIDDAINGALAGLGSVPVPSLGDLGAVVSALGLSVAAIEAISFIGGADCQEKVGQLCNTDLNGLQDLLALATDFFVLASICDVIPLLEDAFSLIAAPLIETLTVVGAGLCNLTTSPPAALSTPALALPTSVDASLHLAA
jgi:hypothetical protein